MAGDNKDLSDTGLNVNTGEVNNSVTLNNATFNIPERVATGLTNLGTAAAIAAGAKGAASIAKSAGVGPAAKLGIIAAGGAITGATAVAFNAINTITQNSLGRDEAVAEKSNSTTASPTTSNPESDNRPTTPGTSCSANGDGSTTPTTSNSESDNGFSAFSIEPNADLDTVMNLLNSNYVLHICIAYLPIAFMFLYLSTMVLEHKWNLIFIKNIFGEKFYSFFIKILTYTSKHNKIWMFIALVALVFASLIALYISYFLLNNIDIVSEIVQRSKPK